MLCKIVLKLIPVHLLFTVLCNIVHQTHHLCHTYKNMCTTQKNVCAVHKCEWIQPVAPGVTTCRLAVNQVSC